MVKLNRIALITVAAVTLAATPLVTFAQIFQPPPAQQRPNQGIPRQSRISQIQAEAVTQIETLLTPEQRTQYKAARNSGQGLIQGLDAVQNLSEKQETQINSIIRKASRQILDAAPRQPPRQR
jgi:hypothetical protein